MDTVKDDMPT